MEKIIQITIENGRPTVLTNEGRIFAIIEDKWQEMSLPSLHTNEIKESKNSNLSK